MERLISLALFCMALVFATPATAQTTVETKVERADHNQPKKPTLRFLQENRDFLRSQLDLLRQVRIEREGQATLLSDRHLMFRGMLDAILAAQDSMEVRQAAIDRLELLRSIRELGDLETQLDNVESLLGDQRDRLVQLEQDFVGRQETALVVLVKGLPEDAKPTGIVFTAGDGSVVRIPLGEAERDALRRGGIAQVFHEFVEPRAQELTLRLDGIAGEHPIAFDPERDRINFVQVDLGQPQPAIERWAR